MKSGMVSALALGVACTLSATATAQTPAEQDPAPDPASSVEPQSAVPPVAEVAKPICCTIPALTVVELEIVDPASSRTSKIGDKIRIRVAEPVMVGGQVVIPKGTEGSAEVIQASKARMMGKAGELVLGVPYLLLADRRINLKRLRYGRSSGHDATQETMIVTAAVGIVGMVIAGGNVDIQTGAQANAVVSADTPTAPIQ